MAPGPGFEPGLEASKAPVLPLNDPGTRLLRISDISSGRRRDDGSFAAVGCVLTGEGEAGPVALLAGVCELRSAAT